MGGERSHVVAIMAAIIYAGRTGTSAQRPHAEDFETIAKAAWDLHTAVVGSEEVRTNRAGYHQQGP